MSSPLADPVPLADVRRALVTKLRHHGDVLLTAPVFSALARAAPHVEIDALVYRETAPLLANHPAIAGVHSIDRAWKSAGLATQLREEASLLATLWARRYDLLIHLTEHPRGLTLAALLRPRYAVTRGRGSIGRRDGLWPGFFTHFYEEPRVNRRHVVEINLDALRRIGIQPSPEDKRLVLVPGAAAQARVATLLAQAGVESGRFLQLHPGARWLFKCWPAEKTAALVDRLVLAGHQVVVTGSPDAPERALVAAVLRGARAAPGGRVVDLAGQLTLPELAALTARARAFIGVDSAPMHIAAAQGTPTVALFGPSGEYSWGPWMVPHRVVASETHACRPCGQAGCGNGGVSECLTTLPVERVYAALASLLAETAPREPVRA